MSDRRRPDWMTRFCALLGRPHALSGFLDWVGRWLIPPPPRVAYAGPGRPAAGAGGPPLPFEPMLMATGPATDGPAPPAPTTPHEGHDIQVDEPSGWSKAWEFIWSWGGTTHHDQKKKDAQHAKAACSESKYHGMHGRPCKYAGGADTKCPAGTVSGWFWRYNTPAGVIYYVDCCGSGAATANKVWCNWSNEINWCLGAGRASAKGISHYFCTLAIPDADMKVVTTGTGGYEVAGVDP
jgi:hypothetical protein